MDAERIYLMTFGSQQGNSDVHCHIAPLPSGAPYKKQQLNEVSSKDGILRLSEDEWYCLTTRIRQRITLLDGIQNKYHPLDRQRSLRPGWKYLHLESRVVLTYF